MRNPAFMFGALLGGAFVAACLNDTFRDKCKQGIIALGNEASGQINQIFSELISGKQFNQYKGQNNGNDKLLQSQDSSAPRCPDGHDRGLEPTD